MLSVTQRVKTVKQPLGGYLPINSFRVRSYNDGIEVNAMAPEYNAFAPIQGMAVDYLTRFLTGSPLSEAFSISLVGAELVSERATAETLLKRIRGLDPDSIVAACSLVHYDVAYRQGTEYYSAKHALEPTDNIIRNIQIMVTRGVAFLKLHQPIVRSGVTFEGGYTSLVSTGDADYLTKDGLWDFKASRNAHNSAETLQLLMYYIMGIHSTHAEFRDIKTLGLFNPLKNESYEIDIADISDRVFWAVSHDVLGFRVPEESSQWRDTDGEDKTVADAFLRSLRAKNKATDFDPQKYEDGIYDISINDYWTFYRDKSTWAVFRPEFPYTKYVKFLKHDGFLMFISVSPKGTLSVMQGGALRKLEKPVQYYYDHLAEYGKKVLGLFSKYWDALSEVSDYVRRVTSGQGSGTVHGCIVDIDFYNHIYINPLDGTITPYYADFMSMKQTYPNLISMISAKLPHLLPAFQMEQSKNPAALALAEHSTAHQALTLTSQEVGEHSEIVYNTDMYSISNRLRALQYIYDHHLIAVWYDSIVSPVRFLPASETEVRLDAKWDEVIERYLKFYISVKSEKSDQPAEWNQSLLWETKTRISQDELFALIRRFCREASEKIDQDRIITFGYNWSGKQNFQYVGVECVLKEVPLFYKQLLKPRKAYQNTVSLLFAINPGEGRKAAEIIISFVGGSSPLAMVGDYKFQNGLMTHMKR